MSSLSRRQLANYTAEQLLAGRHEVVGELAAYLLQARRTKELDVLVMDIEAALMNRGVVVADVSSARSLGLTAKEEVATTLRRAFQAQELHIREHVEPSLLGGVMVQTADHEFDGTLRKTLNQLKALKV
ncbi:MAG TPA: F0F1 ATP synthase subunit delta [Candidatus Saccharibacteria bacterium]|nr:F0F1 ATP synthase subunit delta [Candidatus Saccharibacteria bacterium]